MKNAVSDLMKMPRKPATQSAQSQDFRKDVLIREYERVCDDIRSLEASHDKTVGLGLALLIGSATLGYQHGVHVIFVALPFGAIGVLFYELQVFAYIYSLGGYKRRLEIEINQYCGRKAVCWEEIVRKRGDVNPTGAGLLATVVVLNCGIVVFSVANLIAYKYTTESIVLTVVLCIGLIGWLLYSCLSLGKIYDFMYNETAHAFAEQSQKL